MNKIAKIVIVVVLVILVAAVFALKESDKTKTESNTSDLPTKKTEEVKTLPKLIDLGAEKCIPCKMMAPILEELKKEYTGIFDVEFIDVWKKQDAAKGYAIKIIPTQIFHDTAGKELFRHEGFFSKEDILAKWKELNIDIEKKQE